MLRENRFQVKYYSVIKSPAMHTIPLDADELVHALLSISRTEHVSILDSCGAPHLGSHLLIAGVEPVESFEIYDEADAVLRRLDEVENGNHAAIFTLSYDLGPKIQGLKFDRPISKVSDEPLAFIAVFDTLIIHDYEIHESFLIGNEDKFSALIEKVGARSEISDFESEISDHIPGLSSNFSRKEYIAAIEGIKEKIRDGETYQTNLTRQITAKLPPELSPEAIFARLRRDHPAPFAAFLKRKSSTVISGSPERFFRITNRNPTGKEGVRQIITSPIKGTRPRGATKGEDAKLRQELLDSKKDRAENTMIVDLLRNDLGRVCDYGSVVVEKLCEIEEHPSLFHLVSTVSGELRKDASLSDVLRALFPCGSITGAPKISTMRIIDEIEPDPRGLSMGAIGFIIPERFPGLEPSVDLSVAIRTMVIKENIATFNVGGGIVIDSDPQSEFEETRTKAIALLNALGIPDAQVRA
jgi:para-aminobenzoate synthetase component 1